MKEGGEQGKTKIRTTLESFSFSHLSHRRHDLARRRSKNSPLPLHKKQIKRESDLKPPSLFKSNRPPKEFVLAFKITMNEREREGIQTTSYFFPILSSSINSNPFLLEISK
jgi:hypothetical protein